MGAGLGLFVVALICWLASASSFAFVDVVGLLTSSIDLRRPADPRCAVRRDVRAVRR